MAVTACEKLSKKELPQAWAQAFPGYKGRKFSIQVSRKVGLRGFWDGGTKSEYVAIDLLTGVQYPASEALTNPFNAVAHEALPLRPEFVLAERVWFCGSDEGVTFHCHPDACHRMIEIGGPEREIAKHAKLAVMLATAGV